MELPDVIHGGTAPELKERLEAERRGRPFLLYRDGDQGRQRIEDLADAPDVLTIGRRPTCGIPLPWDPEVSRVHARLEQVESEWTLVDDGRSRNGSYINGERVSGRRRLQDGDTLRFGGTVVVFRQPSGRASMRTATSERDLAPDISSAQRRVLEALCRPYATSNFATPASNQQIADELVLGVETIKTHMRALFDAFGVGHLPQHQKRAELARRALECGLFSARDLDSPPPP